MKKIYREWLEKYKFDLLVWSLFLFYEITVVGLIVKSFGNPITYILHYGINIVTFYIHAIWLFPYALKNGNAAFWRVPVILAIELTGYTLMAYWADRLLISLNVITHVSELKLTSQLVLTSVYRCIYFLGFATGYYFLLNYIREKNRATEQEKQSLIKQHQTEKDLANAKNAFLKAQINPHFLLNTLDFVYHSIDTDTGIAAQAVILLSRMMRYALGSDEREGFIALEEEIEQVENLLYLYQLRNSGDFPIDLICSYEVRTIKFIPLVLLTLVENIFKHGDLNSEAHQAFVKVHLENDSLCIETDNLIDTKAIEHSHRIGLSNVKRRLYTAYGDDAHFSFGVNSDRHFIVTIRVPLSTLNDQELLLDTVIDSDKGQLHEDVDQQKTSG